MTTGLGKLPGEIRRMTYRDAARQLAHWRKSPPVHRLLAMLAGVFTTWRPEESAGRAMTPEEHQASLERRWKAGALNIKQMYEAMGGPLKGVRSAMKRPPGIGPWPGARKT